MTDPYSDQPIKGKLDLPELSEDEVEKRIGVQAPPPRRPPVRVRATRPERARYVGATRRRVLWRDSAIILIGVVLALLAVRFLLPSGASTANGSPSPDDTSIIAAASPTSTALFLTPIPTIGQIVNPSLHLRATPTPIPVITLPPPTPTPRPTPTLAPGATPKTTLKPGSTPKPTATPKPTPTATPAPVFADFSCSPAKGSFTAPVTVTCTDKSSGATSWTWTFGDGAIVTTQNASHTYTTAGSFQITLTVTGPGAMINPTASDCCWDVSL
jgi:hypothetical protein